LRATKQATGGKDDEDNVGRMADWLAGETHIRDGAEVAVVG